MISPHRWRRWAALCFLACSVGVLTGAAQSAPATAPAASAAANAPKSEETIVLSPFEVKTEVDNSYGALASNSLTAFSIDLEKMPATTQVFTSTFMNDIGATNVQ